MARTGRARPKRKAPTPGDPAVVPEATVAYEATPDDAAPEEALVPEEPAPEGDAAAVRRPWRRGVRLGVDVGSVRVGLAACDPDGLVATAVETLRRADPPRPPGQRRRRYDESRDAGAVPEDVLRIAAETRAREAVEVVVGLPRSLSGQEGRAAGLARAYAARLAEAVAPVPVRLVDERLSTAGAHRSLHEGGTSGRRHRSVVDQVAAAWILQTALDLERTSGRPAGPRVRVADAAPHEQGGLPSGRAGQDQHEHDEQHDDEVGGRTGARRTGEDAERRAPGPSVEEDASVSTGPTAPGVPPSSRPRPVPRPGPRGGPGAVQPSRLDAADARGER